MFIYIAFVCTLVLFYFFDRKQFSYWKNLGIPQLKQHFLIGDIKDVVLQRKPIAKFYSDICDQLKSSPVIGIYFSYRPLIIINDVELAKTVLTKDFQCFHDRGFFIDSSIDPLTENLFLLPGGKWKRLRQKMTPLFSSSKLKMMLPIVQDSVDMVDIYIGSNLTENGDYIIDTRDIATKYTLTMISSIAFGTHNDCINDPDNLFRIKCLQVFDQNFVNNMRLLTAIFLPKVCQFFKLRFFDKEVSDFFVEATNKTIEYRETNNIQRNDFMQLLMQLKNEGLKSKKNSNSDTSFIDDFTLNEVAANLFIFVMAGYETTSSTLTYCLYEISKHPEIKRKVQQEMDELKNEPFSYEKINKLKYLENCINESLRKYPIVPILNRQCQYDYKVPNTDHVLPKGTSIIIPIFGLQRNPEIYKDPMTFNPDRFDSKGDFKSLTFGYGNRSCIGSRMAVIVIKTLFFTLLSKYDVELVSSKDEIEFTPKIPSLTPVESILIKFTKR